MIYKDINKKELDQLIKQDEYLLIDIRTKDEFMENNIDKSINIPLNNLLFSIDEIQDYKHKNVIIYCKSGHRSITACNLLSMDGFDNLYNLKNGITGL